MADVAATSGTSAALGTAGDHSPWVRMRRRKPGMLTIAGRMVGVSQELARVREALEPGKSD
jgi:hypothetical protein